jgi:hypothetical protein
VFVLRNRRLLRALAVWWRTGPRARDRAPSATRSIERFVVECRGARRSAT